ncbi:hypothetical protein K438DRAFT_1788743 [Mycena galopus ATCC 62051]|nr:hypothetical protein K438DRAFT_1788743 [Mycena galopus ATCC 62051]
MYQTTPSIWKKLPGIQNKLHHFFGTKTQSEETENRRYGANDLHLSGGTSTWYSSPKTPCPCRQVSQNTQVVQSIYSTSKPVAPGVHICGNETPLEIHMSWAGCCPLKELSEVAGTRQECVQNALSSLWAVAMVLIGIYLVSSNLPHITSICLKIIGSASHQILSVTAVLYILEQDWFFETAVWEFLEHNSWFTLVR